VLCKLHILVPIGVFYSPRERHKRSNAMYVLPHVRSSKALMTLIAYKIGLTILTGILINQLIHLLMNKPHHAPDFFPIYVTLESKEFLLRGEDYNANFLFEKLANLANLKILIENLN
jgi:hypothetical protein